MIEIKFLNIQFFTWEYATRAPFFEPCKYAKTFTNDHATPFHEGNVSYDVGDLIFVYFHDLTGAAHTGLQYSMFFRLQ